MIRSLRAVTAAAIALALSAGSASPATIELDASDSGAYFANGLHNNRIQNYLTGRFGVEHRSFFVFDLGGVSGDITGATLDLFNPGLAPCCLGYVSPDPTETFAVFDVGTPISTLVAGGAGQVAIFEDLGTGTPLGQIVASAADNGSTLSIVLNAEGLTALNEARGGAFAFGGALTTLGDATVDEYLFGFAATPAIPADVRRLTLTVADATVPEPGLWALLAVVLLGVVYAFRQDGAARGRDIH